jgi:hypothetical protein
MRMPLWLNTLPWFGVVLSTVELPIALYASVLEAGQAALGTWLQDEVWLRLYLLCHTLAHDVIHAVRVHAVAAVLAKERR